MPEHFGADQYISSVFQCDTERLQCRLAHQLCDTLQLDINHDDLLAACFTRLMNGCSVKAHIYREPFPKTPSRKTNQRNMSTDKDKIMKSVLPMNEFEDVKGNSMTETEPSVTLCFRRTTQEGGYGKIDHLKGESIELLSGRTETYRTKDVAIDAMEKSGTKEANQQLRAAEKFDTTKAAVLKSMVTPAFQPSLPPLHQAESMNLQSSTVSSPSVSVTATDKTDDETVTRPACDRGCCLIHDNSEAAVRGLEPCKLSPSRCPFTVEDELLNIMANNTNLNHPPAFCSRHLSPSDVQHDPISRPLSPLTTQLEDDDEEDGSEVESDVEDTSSFDEETNCGDSCWSGSTAFKPIRPSVVQDSIMLHSVVTSETGPQNLFACQESLSPIPRPPSPITVQDQHCDNVSKESEPKDSCLINKRNAFLSYYTRLSHSSTFLSVKNHIGHNKPEPLDPNLSHTNITTTYLSTYEKQTLETVYRYDDNSSVLHESQSNRISKVPSPGISLSKDHGVSQLTVGGRHHEVFMKMVIVGDYGVGKSQLLQALCKALSSGKAGEGFRCTAFRPNEFAELALTRKGRKARVKIMDTAGQERFGSLTSSYFRDVHGCFLVFNINQRDSFDHIMQWYADMKKYTAGDDNNVYHNDNDILPSTLLVGVSTPVQSHQAREVTPERAFRLAEGLGTQYVEVTLRDQELLLWLVERMVQDVWCRLPVAVVCPESSGRICISPPSTTGPRDRREFVFCAS